MSNSAKERIIIPLDTSDVGKAADLVEALAPHVGCFKVGLELIYAILASVLCPAGSGEAHRNTDAARRLFGSLGPANLFWDGKLADIPNTVAGATAQINRIGVKCVNVHASCGRAAIRAAVEKATDCKVWGVTVLTSLSEAECISIFGNEPAAKVVEFADMLLEEHADGVISSPQEVKLLRAEPRFDALTLATPGVRPAWAAVGDQKRVMTPGEAIEAGADHLVIGRPITQPPPEIGDPVKAAQLVAEEIESALPKAA